MKRNTTADVITSLTAQRDQALKEQAYAFARLKEHLDLFEKRTSEMRATMETQKVMMRLAVALLECPTPDHMQNLGQFFRGFAETVKPT